MSTFFDKNAEQDDNGKRTPISVSLGPMPKRRFKNPNAKPMTPWEKHQLKQFLLKFLDQGTGTMGEGAR